MFNSSFANECKPIQRGEKGKSIVDLINNYVVIDIETTGLDPKTCEVIEIAALKICDGKIVDKFTSLVKPNSFFFINDNSIEDYCLINNQKVAYVDQDISNLTGISNTMLHFAPNGETVMRQFNEFIDNSILLGHNVNFDINFLYDNNIIYFNKPLSNNFIDTMRISRRMLKDLQHHRLCDIATALNIPYKNAHRAEQDCVITYNCYEKMKTYIYNNYNSIDNFLCVKCNSRKNYNRCNSHEVFPDNKKSLFNNNNALYEKTVVFTGELSTMSRNEAMQSVVNVGGLVSNGITKKTNFLIVGSFEFINSVKGDKSTKIKKAEKMQIDGSDIQIISESMFLEILKG